jgi:predicted dehydrogenase
MEKVRVGLVGVGGIANGKHMPALSKLPNVEIVAFCDLIEERAQKGAKEYGAPGAEVYTDYRKMLERKDIDVVHVLTPNCSHAEISIAAMEAGKDVMCEKPMAINYEQACQMLEAKKRTGRKLTIGYQNRFRQDSLYMKTLCDNNELGEIYYARAHAVRRRGVPTWGVFIDEEKQGGGPLIDIGTHALDLSMWMMDNYDPELVVGSVYHKLSSRKNAAHKFGSWDPAKFTVEDSAFGFIKFKNGATVNLEASWALNAMNIGEAMTTLCGTEGGVHMDADYSGLHINGEAHGKLYTKDIELDMGGVAFYEGGSETDPAVLEAQAWYSHVTNNTPLTTLPEQAAKVTQVLEAIYESAKTGEAVHL